MILATAALAGIVVGSLWHVEPARLVGPCAVAALGACLGWRQPHWRMLALVACASGLGAMRGSFVPATSPSDALEPYLGSRVRLRAQVTDLPRLVGGGTYTRLVLAVGAIGPPGQDLSASVEPSPGPPDAAAPRVVVLADPATGVGGLAQGQRVALEGRLAAAADARGPPILLAARLVDENSSSGPGSAVPDGASQPTAGMGAAAKATEADAQHSDAVVQHGDALAQHSDAVVQHGDALAQHSDAVVQHGDALAQHSDADVQHGDALAQSSDADVQHGDALAQSSDALAQRDDAPGRDSDALVQHNHALGQQSGAQVEGTQAVGEAPPLAELLRQFAQVRQSAAANVQRYLPEPQASLAVGILLGGTGHLSPDFKLDLQRSGLTHVLAIDGYKQVLVAAIAHALVVRLFGARAAILTILALISGYTLLTGAHPSAVRAALMLGMASVATLSGRVADPLTSLALVVLALAAVEPPILLDVGLQLSVSATLGIILLWPSLRRRLQRFPRWIAEPLGLSGAVTLATLPVTLSTFQFVSLVSPIAHVVAVPLLPLVLASTTLLAAFAALPPPSALIQHLVLACTTHQAALAALPLPSSLLPPLVLTSNALQAALAALPLPSALIQQLISTTLLAALAALRPASALLQPLVLTTTALQAALANLPPLSALIQHLVLASTVLEAALATLPPPSALIQHLLLASTTHQAALATLPPSALIQQLISTTLLAALAALPPPRALIQHLELASTALTALTPPSALLQPLILITTALQAALATLPPPSALILLQPPSVLIHLLPPASALAYLQPLRALAAWLAALPRTTAAPLSPALLAAIIADWPLKAVSTSSLSFSNPPLLASATFLLNPFCAWLVSLPLLVAGAGLIHHLAEALSLWLAPLDAVGIWFTPLPPLAAVASPLHQPAPLAALAGWLASLPPTTRLEVLPGHMPSPVLVAAWLAWLPTTLLVWVIHAFGSMPAAGVSTGRLPAPAAVALAAALLALGVWHLPELTHLRLGVRRWLAKHPRLLAPSVCAAACLAAASLISFIRPDGQIHVDTLHLTRGQAVFIRGPSGSTALIVAGQPSPASLGSQVAQHLAVWEHQLNLVVALDDTARMALAQTLARYPADEFIDQPAWDTPQRLELGRGAAVDVWSVGGQLRVAIDDPTSVPTTFAARPGSAN